jgi:hypothetical protein
MYKVKFDTGETVDFQNEPTDADIEEVVKSLGIKPKSATIPEEATKTKPKKDFLDKVGGFASKVANFAGAEGIVDQFSSSLARVIAPKDQEQYIGNPSLKKVLGSAVQTGANLIPGAGVGAKVATKVAIGAGVGYLSDVGGKLQSGTSVAKSLVPGVGTAVGTVLPVLGKIIGFADNAKLTKDMAARLESLNLRLSPVEKQNLQKQGKQIAEYLADKKIIGTPAQRYAKIDDVYNQMEETVTKVIDNANLKVPKQKVVELISKIPEKYTDNLSEFDGVVTKVDKIIKTLKSNFGDEITGTELNKIKRNEWKNAYSKNNTDVINEVSNEVGHVAKGILDENIQGLNPLNDEYGKIITARRALFKATTRPQAGLLGKTAGLVAGSTIGGAIAGPGGAAVGAFVGPQITNAVSTPIRSTVGAGSQKISELINKIPVDERGKLLIGRKALLNLIQGNRD